MEALPTIDSLYDQLRQRLPSFNSAGTNRARSGSLKPVREKLVVRQFAD
jgi:hypothetical protein